MLMPRKRAQFKHVTHNGNAPPGGNKSQQVQSA